MPSESTCDGNKTPDPEKGDEFFIETHYSPSLFSIAVKYSGTVNTFEFEGRPAGTLMFLGVNSHSRNPVARLAFKYREQPWNQILDVETNTWREIRLAATGEPFYKPADFDALLAEVRTARPDDPDPVADAFPLGGQDPVLRALHKRWYELVPIELHSPEFALVRRLRVFEISVGTLRGNFEALSGMVRSLESRPPHDDLTAPEFGDTVTPQLQAICTALLNYLAATASLIDHSRVLFKEIDTLRERIPTYDDEVTRNFKKNGLALLIKELRNVHQHVRTPIVGLNAHTSYTARGRVHTACVFLKKGELLACDLPKAAREFTEAQPASIPLLSLIDKHYNQIIAFNDWFREAIERAHATEYEFVRTVEGEQREIAAKIRERYESRKTSMASEKS